MNQRKHCLIAALAVLIPVWSASAKPQLFVNYEGLSESGNHQWLVSAAPDPAFFSSTTSSFGSSLAVELAFAVEGSSIVNGSIVINGSDWPAQNPGNNPFLNAVTEGVWLSGPFDGGVNQAFASMGSNVFLSGAPVSIFGFETLGSDPTTVYYGVAASGDPVRGSIIAQTGQNFPAEFENFGALTLDTFGGSLAGSPDPGFREFTGYTGSVNSVPEPTAAALIMLAVLCGWQSRSRKRG